MNGQNFQLSSQRNFTTTSEADDYLRRFACARIEDQLTRQTAVLTS
jgi:hypothetical protein